MATHNFRVRVLIFPGCNAWVAQCLEHDIATQGTKIKDALDSMERVILGQTVLDVQDGIEPLSEIAPAPNSFFEMFEQAYHLQNVSTFQPPQKILHQPIRAEAAIAA